MKTNQRTFIKLSTISLFIFLIAVFTQCGNSSQKTTHKPSYTKEVKKDEGQIINELQVSEGMKNHEQIFNTMSALTGVTMTGSVKTVYDQVATSLPTDNDIKVFLPSHQLAITKLAAEFCKVLLDTEALRVVIWPTLNFTLDPATTLNMAGRDLLIEEMLQAFWGGVTSPDEKTQSEIELHQLIADLLVGEANTQVTTRNIAKGVCTSALASAHVTLL